MANEGKKDYKRRKLDHTADAPTALTITRLVDSHAKEIRALTQAVQGKKKRNTAQDIPHYMRRRAASHNLNRLPRNVRNKISKNKIPPGKPKKPSRYHKRRPKNLTAEFTRRQRRVRWLETHIWHAKRFHMIEKWGYRLPHYPTEKGERAAYRAATNHCLIQDQSYIHCIEIKAPLLTMIQTLNKLIPNSQLDTGSVLGLCDGRSVLRGSLYDPDSYPPSAICPVEIVFNSSPTNPSHPPNAWNQQHIWLWCHVTAQPTVWSIIRKQFHVRCQEEDFSESDADSRAQYPDMTISDGSVSVKSLVDSVIRFRLNGRETLETLDRVIKPTTPSKGAVGAHVWWKEELGDTYGEITTSIKESYDHRTAPPGAVLTVRARDPRLCMTQIQKHMTDLREKKVELAEKQRERSMYGLSLPQEETNDSIGKQKEKKQKAEKTAKSKSVLSNDESGPAPLLAPPPCSPLWRDSVRRTVSSEMMSQYDINKRRSQLLVPGSELSLGDEESCVPLMLLLDQKSATLIMPANWGLPFWVAFQYAGARPGGLRESRMIDFETGIPHFPNDFPDSAICAQQETTDAEELEVKHHKYPPNKRPNYDKLNTNSPFRCDWSGIIEGSSPAVLRDLSCVQSIQRLLEPDGTEPSASDYVNIVDDSNLLHVSLSMINRGVPEERAEICIPTTDDISELRLGKCKYGFEMPLNKTKTVIPRDETHTVVEMKDRLTPCREVFGFVKYGRYSQGTGTSKGKGFVSLQTLLRLAVDKTMIYQTDKVSGLLCLVRSVDSRQYRWASLNTL